MSFRVRYTRGARDDLKRLYGFLLERDVAAAEHALEAIRKATEVLRSFPFTCRKVDHADPFLRELIVPFGECGYVALFEIEGRDDSNTSLSDEVTRYVTILAVRQQREDDYH